MRVTVYKQRIRKLEGLATGDLAIELESYDPVSTEQKHFLDADAARTIKRVAKWLHDQATKRPFADGSSMRVTARVRAPHGGLRKVVLVRASFPRDVELALACLRTTWLPVPREAWQHEAVQGWLDEGE